MKTELSHEYYKVNYLSKELRSMKIGSSSTIAQKWNILHFEKFYVRLVLHAIVNEHKKLAKKNLEWLSLPRHSLYLVTEATGSENIW